MHLPQEKFCDARKPSSRAVVRMDESPLALAMSVDCIS
jgi:hypothetical protein